MQDNPTNQPLQSSREDIAELVERQLARILESSYFNTAKQMQNFLKYIVRKTLAGEGNTLKQYTIAVEALGFPVDFDSDTNPVVRIKAGRVRERLAKYYENEGENDALVISIPKGSYATVFENKIPVRKVSVSEGNQSSLPKLAVLCYSDETQDKESNRLLFQVTDTMVKELSHFLFSRLVVSIPHADKKESHNGSIDIKKRYQADYMLIFYIQQQPNNQHTLIVRLMDVDDEEILWSESYEILSNKLFSEHIEVIGNITAIVADVQQGVLYRHWARKLLEDENLVPEHRKALAYYRYYSDDLGHDSFKLAVRVCEQRLEENPNDVICKVLYSDYCRREYVYGYGVIEDPLVTGKKTAQDAMRLRPDSHETHYVLGQILFCLNERTRSLDEFNLARDICQYHAYVEYGIGLHFCLMGKWDEGWGIVKNVMSVSPNYSSLFNMVPFLYYYQQGNYDEALSYAGKIDAPALFYGAFARCVSYAQLDDMEQSRKEFDALLENNPKFLETGKGFLNRYLGSQDLTDRLWGGMIKLENS